jgi:hypothetical protein
MLALPVPPDSIATVTGLHFVQVYVMTAYLELSWAQLLYTQ